jgi:hypothetical protein
MLSEVVFPWMHKRLVVALVIDGWSRELAEGGSTTASASGERG